MHILVYVLEKSEIKNQNYDINQNNELFKAAINDEVSSYQA